MPGTGQHVCVGAMVVCKPILVFRLGEQHFEKSHSKSQEQQEEHNHEEGSGHSR